MSTHKEPRRQPRKICRFDDLPTVDEAADRYMSDAAFRQFADRMMAWLTRLKPGHSLNIAKMDEPRRSDCYMVVVAFFALWPDAERDYCMSNDYTSIIRRNETFTPKEIKWKKRRK